MSASHDERATRAKPPAALRSVRNALIMALLAVAPPVLGVDVPHEHTWLPARAIDPPAAKPQRLLPEQWIELRAGPRDRRPPELTEVDRALLAAIASGEAVDVGKLLAAGANPNARDLLAEPPLVLAARRGDPEIVRQLLRAGAAPDIKGARGFRPLVLAALRDHRRVVDLLIAAGAQLDARSDNGATALLTAAGAGRNEIVAGLLKHGADWMLFNREGLNAIGVAASAGHIAVLENLLDHGADPNRLDRTRKPPLFWAVYHKQRDAVRVLLARGAEAGSIAYDIFPQAFSEAELKRR